MKNLLIMIVASTSIMVSCSHNSGGESSVMKTENCVSDTVVDSIYKPSRKAEPGFEWKEFQGSGLRFYAQCSPTVRAVTDASVPGIRIERVRGGKKEYSEPVVRVFTIDTNFIESLLRSSGRRRGCLKPHG